MPNTTSTYFSPTCYFCGKNNKRRHSRRGHTWTCDHCHEVNPGPMMMKKLLGKLAEGPTADGMRRGAAKAAPRVAVTKIKTAVLAVTKAKAKTSKPSSSPNPEPASTRPAPAAAAPSAPAKPTAKRGLGDWIFG